MAAVLLPPVDDITGSVLAFFRQVEASGYDGRYAGDALKPPGRYWILYRIAGGSSDALPTMDDRRDTVALAYQLTCVGMGAENGRRVAERLAVQLYTAWVQRDTDTGLHVRPLKLPVGWVAAHRHGPDEAPGVDPTGAQPTTAFQVPLRFGLTVTPA